MPINLGPDPGLLVENIDLHFLSQEFVKGIFRARVFLGLLGAGVFYDQAAVPGQYLGGGQAEDPPGRPAAKSRPG